MSRRSSSSDGAAQPNEPNEKQHVTEALPEGATTLMGLFAPPTAPPPPPPSSRPDDDATQSSATNLPRRRREDGKSDLSVLNGVLPSRTRTSNRLEDKPAALLHRKPPQLEDKVVKNHHHHEQSSSPLLEDESTTETNHALREEDDDERETVLFCNKKDGTSNERTPLLLRDSSLNGLFDSPPTTGGVVVGGGGKKRDSVSASSSSIIVPHFHDTTTPKMGTGRKFQRNRDSGGGGGGAGSAGTTMPFLPYETRAAANQHQHQQHHKGTPSTLPPIEELHGPVGGMSPHSFSNDAGTSFTNGIWDSVVRQCSDAVRRCKQMTRKSFKSCFLPTTYIGSFMFLLYHIVFCLTMGSAITRPHGTVSMIGVMTKMAALGIMFGAPVYWVSIGELPALYPTVDLFTAPFLAHIAAAVDDTLHNDPNVPDQENDEYFLASFGLLSSIAIFISGALLVLASVFKLANAGAYLPFPVICGFFAAVGVLTWTLAVKIDSNGASINRILFSGDWDLIKYFLIHHSPSVIVAALMKYAGPKNPFYVVGLVFCTIGMFYVAMFVWGLSLEDMVELGWFWSKDDLVYAPNVTSIGFSHWSPPAPFGWIHSLLGGKVHLGAVSSGLGMTIALSFLYMIRISLHGAALKKNVPQLSRVEGTSTASTSHHPSGGKQHSQGNNTNLVAVGDKEGSLSSSSSIRSSVRNLLQHRRNFSEAVDIEQILKPAAGGAAAAAAGGNDVSDAASPTSVVSPKPTQRSLKEILLQYGYSQFISAAIGGFAITPSVAASPTMYMLRAEHIAPQVGSIVLLTVFYLTDFVLISYIPKPAFSSMLVLAFIDMMYSWAIKSYFRTKDKWEWLTVPAIIACSVALGLLSAVFLGIAASTFLFVAQLFRSGVVKYIANGMNLRSNIERSIKAAKWLDQNGDLIQILVLQNYLFFGNASSILNYVSSMFEDPQDCAEDVVFLPPLPKVVVVDVTLVTGMDTSSVDVFKDMAALCSTNDCKLFLSGMSSNLRKVMYLGGVKPETALDRSTRQVRFFHDLDTAIGKAEDMLLRIHNCHDDEVLPPSTRQRGGGGSKSNNGFERALQCIDEQHETQSLQELIELHKYMTVIEVKQGQALYEDVIVVDRGLFFIEHGVLKIERSTDMSLTRGHATNEAFRRISMNDGSINQIKARSGTIGRDLARMKAAAAGSSTSAAAAGGWDHQTFRVARIGPGWVLGSIEALSGMENHRGRTVAVSDSRLHYISYQKLDEIEVDDPLLILKLYKLLSKLMAKRQETTIWQLGTLHAIMTSPAQKQPRGRLNNMDSLGANSSFQMS